MTFPRSNAGNGMTLSAVNPVRPIPPARHRRPAPETMDLDSGSPFMAHAPIRVPNRSSKRWQFLEGTAIFT